MLGTFRLLCSWTPAESAPVKVCDKPPAPSRKLAAGGRRVMADPIPRARAVRPSAQPIESGVFTAVAFDGVAWDTDHMHDGPDAGTRLTARTAGLYVITASFEWEPDPLGWRATFLRVGDATNIAYDQRLAVKDAGTMHAITGQYLIGVGAYVELLVWQNSGRAVNVGGGAHVETSLSMTWLGP
jgi:hypothetical protein